MTKTEFILACIAWLAVCHAGWAMYTTLSYRRKLRRLQEELISCTDARERARMVTKFIWEQEYEP